MTVIPATLASDCWKCICKNCYYQEIDMLLAVFSFD